MDLYVALGDAPGVQESPPVSLVRTFEHATLERAWREYAPVAVAWHPPGAPSDVRVYADALGAGSGPSWSVLQPATVDAQTARAWADAFLANLTHLRDEARAAALDTLFANATTQGDGSVYYAGPLPDATRYDTLFREATGNAPAPREEDTANGGKVTAGDWTFTFWFPLRVLRVESDGERLFAQANSHGLFVTSVDLAEAVDEDGAREAWIRLLASVGATGADVAAWDLEPAGSSSTSPGSLPQPTQ